MSGRDGSWPLVPLRQVVARSQDWIDLKPDERYRQVTVRLWGKGVVLRNEVDGIQVAATRRLRVRTSQLILSRIDARNGAIGIVPDELDGAIASNDFPAFDVDTSLVLPAYLGWLTRTRSFVEACRAASEGTTNRIRLVENRFLGIEIPLPPLDEQRRIVARLKAIEPRHVEAEHLRRHAAQALDTVLPRLVDAELARLRALGHPISTVSDHALLVTSGPRDFAANYSATGLRFFRAQDIGSEQSIVDDNVVWVESPQGTNRRATVHAGDVLVVITGATIGRSAVVEDRHAEGLVSQHVGLIRVDRSALDPRYLHAALLAPSWAGGQLLEHQYGQGKPGLNLGNLRDLRFPLPSMPEQRRVVEHVEAVRARLLRIKQSHARITADLRELERLVLTQVMAGRTSAGADPHPSLR